MSATTKVVLVAVVVALAAPAGASEPHRRCAAIKMFAAARHYQCMAIESGRAVPNFAKCDKRLDKKFASAERRADNLCPGLDEEDAIAAFNGQQAGNLAAALAGGPPLAPRFVDHGDGTVTDTRTGLTWEKLGDDGSIHDKDDTYLWSAAMAVKIAALNLAAFGGHTDWRLPNINELRSIVPLRVNLQEDPPVARDAFHQNCTPGCSALSCSCTGYLPGMGFYWSSTSDPATPFRALTVETASVTDLAMPKTPVGGLVRAVRGGS